MGFVEGFSLEKQSIENKYTLLDDGEVMAHVIASHFSLNPWQVKNWSYTRLISTYAYVDKRSTLEDIVTSFNRFFNLFKRRK